MVGVMAADQILGNSPAIVKLREIIARVAPTDGRVLITGENGSGKELVAQAVHKLSRRADKPLVVVNCAAIPAELIESELFGHVRGAFTGAQNDRVGRFEAANGGTLFLDEVGDMPQQMQAKLLRALQQGEVTRVGATQPVHVDVRVIAATNRDLAADVAAGRFRQDLLFRLDVLHLTVPALRDRRGDIPLLLDSALARAATAAGRTVPVLLPSARALIAGQSFPGNVRELENLAERIVVLCDTAAPVSAFDIASLVGEAKVDLELLRDLERGSTVAATPVPMPQPLATGHSITVPTTEPVAVAAPPVTVVRQRRTRGTPPQKPAEVPATDGGPSHGTRTRYSRGCHCDLCKAANTYACYVYRATKMPAP